MILPERSVLRIPLLSQPSKNFSGKTLADPARFDIYQITLRCLVKVFFVFGYFVREWKLEFCRVYFFFF